MGGVDGDGLGTVITGSDSISSNLNRMGRPGGFTPINGGVGQRSGLSPRPWNASNRPGGDEDGGGWEWGSDQMGRGQDAGRFFGPRGESSDTEDEETGAVEAMASRGMGPRRASQSAVDVRTRNQIMARLRGPEDAMLAQQQQ